MIKRDRGLVAIIQMQNDPFFDSLWPFYMIKINLGLINLFILHLYRTKRTMQKQSQRCKNTEPTRSQKQSKRCKKWRNSTAQPELGFLFGPITKFFPWSQWWASSQAQPIGSPLADRPTIQRCGAVLVIQRRGACTQPTHLVPSRRPDLRAVAWREGMIGRLTSGARVRQNPAGFRGILSWSTGFRRL